MALKYFLWLLTIISPLSVAGPSDLTYEYTIPSNDSRQLVIINHTNSPISISSLSFKSNAKITGNPSGSLWNWQSTLDTKPDDKHLEYQYVIYENPAVTIPAAGTAILSYNIDPSSTLGPLNVAMEPNSMNVKILNTTQNTMIPIEGLCQNQTCIDPGHGHRIMGYLTNWSYWHVPQFTARQMPWNKINMVSYAHFIFDNNGNIGLKDMQADSANIPLISQARRKYPYLHALMSFGGWSWSSTPPNWRCSIGESPNGPAACFQQMAANPQAVKNFVQNAVSGMREINFSGIDIDWEFPSSPDDINHYIALLQELRLALNAQGEQDSVHYQLTIAVSGGVDKIKNLSSQQWQVLNKIVDQIDVMTYDFHGAFDQGVTGSNFQSAMGLDPQADPSFSSPILGQYNVNDALDNYLQMGVPPSKLVIGIPLYGRMMSIASLGDHKGLYQPIIGTPLGEWDDLQSGPTGLIDYNCIIDDKYCGHAYQLPALTFMQPLKNSEGHYAKTPWGYSDNLFLTFDDATSAAYKSNWAKNKGLLGVMLWDCSGDVDINDKRSIIAAISAVYTQRPRM
jgi:chitinase